MADLLTDDELDLEEQRKRSAAQPIGPVISPSDNNADLIRYAGGMSSHAIGEPIAPAVAYPTRTGLTLPGEHAPMDTSNAPYDSTLTPPKSEAIGEPLSLGPGPAARPNYQHYEELLNEKPKAWSDLGIGGKIGRVAESIGGAIVPGAVAMIPGTRLHHQVDIGHARTAAEEENREIASQGEEQLRAAQAEEQKALAKKNAAGPAAKFVPAVIAGPNGEPIAANFNPQTGQYHNPDTGEQIMGAKKWEKPVSPPRGNDFDSYYAKWLKDNKQQDTAANQLKAHREWEVEGGKPQQEQGSYMPLYDERGHVTGAWNPKTGHVTGAPKGITGTTAPGEHIASTADAAVEKKAAPLRGIIEEADKAATLKDLADKGNAEADVDLALTFFKTMRSATQGGSGIRFTQQENNLIMGARNFWGTLEVKGNKLFSNGEPLSKTQRQQILDVINVHRQAAQRQLDELKQGSGGGAEPSPTAGGGGNAPTAPGVTHKFVNGKIVPVGAP